MLSCDHGVTMGHWQRGLFPSSRLNAESERELRTKTRQVANLLNMLNLAGAVNEHSKLSKLQKSDALRLLRLTEMGSTGAGRLSGCRLPAITDQINPQWDGSAETRRRADFKRLLVRSSSHP